ncbi:unnamed protein product [Agarophyton chilense]
MQPYCLRYGKSASQYVLLHSPPGHYARPRPLVVLLHGGFWKGAYGLQPATAACETLAPDLTAHGFLIAEVEYRRSGDACWGWPHTNNDVHQAFDATLSHLGASVDAANIVLLGHSAGGTLALWLRAQLAHSHAPVQPRLVLALAPVADLKLAARLRLSDGGDAVQRYLRGSSRTDELDAKEPLAARYARACPTAHAATLATVNVRLVAGAGDRDVPLPVIDSLCESIRDAPMLHARPRGSLALDVFSRASHYDLVDASSAAWAHIRRTLLKLCTTDAKGAATYPPP